MDNSAEQQSTKSKILAVLWPRLRSMIGGMGSGVAKCVVGHPFDTLKVRMQNEGFHGRFRGTLHTLFKTVREEGILAVYKGASLPMLGWGVIDTFLWFGLLESRRQVEKYRNYSSINDFTLFDHALCGSIAGWTSTLASTPIEQIKARLQVQYADPSTKIYSGPIDCGRQLIKNNGIFGLYKGMSGSMIFRTFIAFYFTSYFIYKQQMNIYYNDVLPASLINFISGGMAANTFWTFALPADCIKNRMMAQPDVIPRLYPTVMTCVKAIWTVEGIGGFYRGIVPCALRSFPTNGAAFMTAELVLKYLPEHLE